MKPTPRPLQPHNGTPTPIQMCAYSFHAIPTRLAIVCIAFICLKSGGKQADHKNMMIGRILTQSPPTLILFKALHWSNPNWGASLQRHSIKKPGMSFHEGPLNTNKWLWGHMVKKNGYPKSADTLLLKKSQHSAVPGSSGFSRLSHTKFVKFRKLVHTCLIFYYIYIWSWQTT